MHIPRTKCISTKVTDDEYATLERVAAGQTLSAWTRDVLLATATPHPADQVILAELVALRTIPLNLHFAVVTGETLTAEGMQRLIERADQDKIQKAQERLASTSTRRQP